jgi:hypothetical protein
MFPDGDVNCLLWHFAAASVRKRAWDSTMRAIFCGRAFGELVVTVRRQMAERAD